MEKAIEGEEGGESCDGLRDAGIEFIPSNGGGVRLKKPE
jgi:hypothetical protein